MKSVTPVKSVITIRGLMTMSIIMLMLSAGFIIYSYDRNDSNIKILNDDEEDYFIEAEELSYHPFYLLEYLDYPSSFPLDLTPKTPEQIAGEIIEKKFPTTKFGPRIK